MDANGCPRQNRGFGLPHPRQQSHGFVGAPLDTQALDQSGGRAVRELHESEFISGKQRRPERGFGIDEVALVHPHTAKPHAGFDAHAAVRIQVPCLLECARRSLHSPAIGGEVSEADGASGRASTISPRGEHAECPRQQPFGGRMTASSREVACACGSPRKDGGRPPYRDAPMSMSRVVWLGQIRRSRLLHEGKTVGRSVEWTRAKLFEQQAGPSIRTPRCLEDLSRRRARLGVAEYHGRHRKDSEAANTYSRTIAHLLPRERNQDVAAPALRPKLRKE